MIATALGESGYDVSVANSVGEAEVLLRGREFDVALLDMHLPDGTGMDVLRRLTEDGSLTETLMLTGNRDIAAAIEVMKLGASDYLVKPTPLAELEIAVSKARERSRLRKENQALRARLGRHETPTSIVTEDPGFLRIIASVAQLGPSDLPVLIQGESGTGKELLARAIHDSGRRMESFVAFSCAGVPDDQLEIELFGLDRGAGQERKPGLLELADGGTLFLDEIDGMGAAVQPKLLRALETQEFSRLGSSRTVRARVRLVTGTKQDLGDSASRGTFREDLYLRINGITLTLPPLRDRPNDVLPLSLHFLKLHGTLRGLSPRALEAMKAYGWPGNVRELQMVVRRAGVLARGDLIEPADLPFL